MTMLNEYLGCFSRREYGNTPFVKIVFCDACGEGLPKDEAIEKDGGVFHRDCEPKELGDDNPRP